MMAASGQGTGSNNDVFTGVKVFSATMAQERDQLGEKITQWLAANPNVHIVDKIVTQSSDEAFHCLAITLFFTVDAK
jgi:hypothetical protein